MRAFVMMATPVAIVLLSSSVAQAACTGSNGRGWGSGQGSGSFEMTSADRTCRIAFPHVINDRAGTQVPASKVSFTRQPTSGKVSVSGGGLVYTPGRGFKGTDTFCTSNTAPKAPGVTLAGCISVTVR